MPGGDDGGDGDGGGRDAAVRRVRESLAFLPGGVPASLWNYNARSLAEAIVDGEKRLTFTGVELVLIGGKWYYNDPGDFLTYLREYPGD